MKIAILTFVCISCAITSVQGQFFQLKKSYTGSHFAFKRVNPKGLNDFFNSFNDLYAKDLTQKFHQLRGGEFGQTFTTSGLRVIFGKREDFKWTISTDYAYGAGKDKNEAHFSNGIEQHMKVRYSSFGVALKENKFWLEGMYCANISKITIEYSTLYPNGSESFSSEYKLNGLYTANLSTQELGIQLSYKRKKYVLYTRALLPIFITGPDKSSRSFVDPRNGNSQPTDFPSNYKTYSQNPNQLISNGEQLKSTGFKGFSYGFGLIYLIGKAK